MLDTSGRVVLWGPGAEGLLGWSGAALIGRRVQDLMVEPAQGEVRTILEQAAGTGRWRGPARMRARDGGTVAVELRMSLLRDGDGVPFLLVTLAEAAKVEAVERDLALRDALFEQSALGMVVLDTELRYLAVNQALARMDGSLAAEHIGRTAGEMLPGRTADEVTTIQRQVMSTGEPIVDVTVASPDRRPGYRSISYNRLTDRAGTVLGLSGIVMDATDRYRAVARVEHARRRLALLNEFGSRVRDLLDASHIAQELAGILVPRLADYSGVLLAPAVAAGEELPRASLGGSLVRLGVGSVAGGPKVEKILRRGVRIDFAEDSVFDRAVRGGIPETMEGPEQLRRATYPGDPKIEGGIALGIHSALVVPLRARGAVIGLLLVSRAGRRETFDRDDRALTVELADRAAGALDNARLYTRERTAALTLQRSLLPQQVPQRSGVEVAYRYVPGSKGTEVGGDWFDVIPLPGDRTALVVGDVMGRGLRAAATMGRLRTAVRTLAAMDLPPDVLLRSVHDLADDLAQGPADPLVATCVYAVYDPATRRCRLAKAGHVPPVLVTPPDGAAATGPLLGGTARVLDLPSGAPLGVGGVPFESVDLDVPPGGLLALCTDGLVESRERDLDHGLRRLAEVLEAPHPSLEEAGECVVGIIDHGREPDDAALLLARFGHAPEHRTAAWVLPAQAAAAPRSRRLVRTALQEWGVGPAAGAAELLVGEVVTDIVRRAGAPVGVRLALDTTLLVEVSDPLPRLRTGEPGPAPDLVRRTALRSGVRAEGRGETVWFELAVPSEGVLRDPR